MIKNSITSALVAASLFAGVLTTPLIASAQGVQNTDYSTQNSQTTNSTGGFTSNSTTNQSNPGFDWRWLLPLLAIPVVLYFLLGNRNTDDDREEYRSRGFAGAKGGRVSRRREIEEEEDVDTDTEV